MNLIASSLLLVLGMCMALFYGVVAWLEYDEDRRTYGTDKPAALRHALTWPVRVYHFWRAE